MKLQELVKALELTELTPVAAGEGEADVTQGYASDLLSDVLAHAPSGGVLVTLQVHLNVIAVASHAGLRAVIFSSSRTPEDDIISKAVHEGLSLYVSPADTFDIVGRLYQLGVRGRTA
jgi:hypothetical protein